MSTAKNYAGASFESLYPRLLHFGVAYSDLVRIDAPEMDWTAWGHALAERGATFDVLAEQVWLKGRKVSAMEFWRKATDYFHYAQIKMFDSPEKREFQAKCRWNFSRLAPHLKPEAIRLEIPFKSAMLPGYLRIAAPGAPCVIIIGGLDSTKEVELFYFAETFLRRGNSVFFFDGPGQGELCGQLPITVGFDAAVSAAIDYLSVHPMIDGKRMGLFGVSFGGYLACHAAALDDRIKACISLGGFFDSKIFRRLPPVAINTVKRAFGLREHESLETLASEVTLEPLKGCMERPLFVVHGSNDHLVDAEQIDALSDWACGLKRIWNINGAEHVCTDRFNECLPEMGDWMSEQLGNLVELPPDLVGRECANEQEIYRP